MRRLMVGLAVVVFFSWTPAEVTADYVFYDFNDGKTDGWVFPYVPEMTQHPGLWSVDEGVLVSHFGNDGNTGLVDNLLLSDQVIETQVRAVGYAGIVLWYEQVSDNWYNSVTIVHNYQTGVWVSESIDGNWYGYNYGGHWIGNDRFFDLRVEADSTTGILQVVLDGTSFVHQVGTLHRTGLSGVWAGNDPGYFDNFRLTSNDLTVVPAPSSLACLVGVGVLVGLNEWRKKRRASKRT